MRLLTLKGAPVSALGLSAVGCLSGGRQLPAKPSRGASVVGTSVSPSPGPRSLDTEGTPTRPHPLFGHRWEWEAEHIVEISGDPSPFALGR